MTEAEALDEAAKAAGWGDYNIALYNDGDVESIRAHAKTIMENAALKAENERLREAIKECWSKVDLICRTALTKDSTHD